MMRRWQGIYVEPTTAANSVNNGTTKTSKVKRDTTQKLFHT